MSAIAELAQMTTAALHYYFENKENLYKAVLQRPIDEVQATLGQLNFEGLSHEEVLKQIILIAIANEAKIPSGKCCGFKNPAKIKESTSKSATF